MARTRRLMKYPESIDSKVAKADIEAKMSWAELELKTGRKW